MAEYRTLARCLRRSVRSAAGLTCSSGLRTSLGSVLAAAYRLQTGRRTGYCYRLRYRVDATVDLLHYYESRPCHLCLHCSLALGGIDHCSLVLGGIDSSASTSETDDENRPHQRRHRHTYDL